MTDAPTHEDARARIPEVEGKPRSTEMSPEQRTKVMIIEDDADIREALAALLCAHGYDVALAADGMEAMEALERGDPPSVILLDLLMPGIVGQSLLDWMRSDGRFAGIPVAIVSAVPQYAPAGVKVFRKPVAAPALLEFLRESTRAPEGAQPAS
jgi:CheY-like chemotaxis protein